MSVSRGVLLALYCDAECLSINVYLYPLSGHSPRVDRLTSSQSGWLLPSERSLGDG